jgi:sterile alpha motif domain-containing protein 13
MFVLILFRACKVADLLPANTSDWSIEDVENFIKFIGFTEEAKSFREQDIDGKSLLLLARSDVLTGFSIKLGPALKIYAHISRLQTKRR